MMKESLGRGEVLRNRRDIRRVLRTGRRIAGEKIELRFQRQPERGKDSRGYPTTRYRAVPVRRVAFLLKRGVSGAVRRNRLKRRLRELYRRNKDLFPAGCDYLIRVSAEAADLEFEMLAAQMTAVALRAQDAESRD